MLIPQKKNIQHKYIRFSYTMPNFGTETEKNAKKRTKNGRFKSILQTLTVNSFEMLEVNTNSICLEPF